MEQDGIPPQPNSGQPGGFPPPQPGAGQHDGFAQQGGFQQPGGFPQAPQGYGQPYIQYPEESQAVLSLVLSIVGLVACSGLLCPIGWHFGKKELEGIDAGRRDPSKRDMAKAGQIIGLIGTLLLALGFLVFIGIMVLAFASAASA